VIAKRLAKLESRVPVVLDHGAALASVLKQLEQIGARRRAVAGWTPPTEAQCAAILKRVEAEAVRNGMTVA
jgi:hypothetical protein